MHYVYVLILLSALIVPAFAADDVKMADLAGEWYPASREELTGLLGGYLDDAKPDAAGGQAFAIISPHAGYRFSGPVAAYGFKALESEKIKTVIIIGFAHRKFFPGIAVYDRGSFRTPLGDIAVDARAASELISKNERISFRPEAFEGENSVEMQIPFIQLVLPGARILPIAFGSQSYDDAVLLAGALADLLKGRDDYLMVASTDMSHYHPYDEANTIDRHTIALLEKMDAKELYDEARLELSQLCGIMPVATVILAGRAAGFDHLKILRYANSGDTFGNKDSVVGYLSAVIYKESIQHTVYSIEREEKKEEKDMLNDIQRKRLLQIARESIAGFVKEGKRKSFAEGDPALNAEMGAFVTLHEAGELKGCIGNMVGRGPLCQTVADMAIEAATGDPRFARLSPDEVEGIDIEISVLSPLRKVSGPGEVKVPGHGVLVRNGFRSGVYLPQVAVETGWNKEEFLTSLCGHKAGLKPDAWKDPATEIYVFTAEVFGEKGGGK